MEILVRRNDLVKELHLVQGIVERKNSIPILSNVLVEARADELRISATDLDVSLRSGCQAQVIKEGAVTLAAKKLYEIVRSLPESDVRLEVQPDAWATIECERVVFRMAGLPREDFPTLPDEKAGKALEIPADVLRGLIQRTGFAITAEDARYYLAGALLILEQERAAMVATDGHRLAYAKATSNQKVTETIKVLVPRKAIAELGRLIEGEETVGFQRSEGHLIFTGRWPDPGLQARRGAVPGIREGDHRHWRQEAGPRARGLPERHPPCQPALVRAQPSDQGGGHGRSPRTQRFVSRAR